MFARILTLLVGVMLAGRVVALDFSNMQDDNASRPVDEVFRLDWKKTGEHRLQLHWAILPGYKLYQRRTTVAGQGADAGELQWQGTPIVINDPAFGPQPVFHDDAIADVDIALQDARDATLSVRYQGCAESGTCYPPQTRVIALAGVFPDANASHPGVTTLLGGHGALMTLAIFFVMGLGLAFTPCMFPMLPILSSVVLGDARTTLDARRAFVLASSYVLGMASLYAVAGSLTGYFGARFNLQAWVQTPLVLVGMAGVFIALALAMFGAFELQLPAFLRDRVNDVSQRQRGGKAVAVYAMGAVSALVVSPCVSAPLAGALVYISTTGNVALGGGSLFSLGLGMGAPLVAITAFGGGLLPRAGAWMERVKRIFGVALLLVALMLLWRAWPAGLVDRLLDAGTTSAQASRVFTRVDSAARLHELLERARLAHRPVVLDVYADWCSECVVMERTLFPRPKVRDALSQVEALQLDVTDHRDDQLGEMQRLGVFGPPALRFFDASGHERRDLRLQGEPTPETLTARIRTLTGVPQS